MKHAHDMYDIMELAEKDPNLHALIVHYETGGFDVMQMLIEMVIIQSGLVLKLQDILEKRLVQEPMRVEVSDAEFHRILNLVSKNE